MGSEQFFGDYFCQNVFVCSWRKGDLEGGNKMISLDKIFNGIENALKKGEKAALVTITDSHGSTPSKIGSMMGVFADGSSTGTIGGGNVEKDVVESAVKAMEENKESFSFSYDLTKEGELEMVCGGSVSGFVNVLTPNYRLVIFGAGHVAQKIAKAAEALPFDIYVVDDREELVTEFGGLKQYISLMPDKAAEIIPFDHKTYVVIATRGHQNDLAALLTVINKETAYIGLMGSKAKVADIKEKLVKAGIEPEGIKNFYTPVGLDISDGTPAEIAISVLAEILAVKNKGKVEHKSLVGVLNID